MVIDEVLVSPVSLSPHPLNTIIERTYSRCDLHLQKFQGLPLSTPLNGPSPRHGGRLSRATFKSTH